MNQTLLYSSDVLFYTGGEGDASPQVRGGPGGSAPLSSPCFCPTAPLPSGHHSAHGEPEKIIDFMAVDSGPKIQYFDFI